MMQISSSHVLREEEEAIKICSKNEMISKVIANKMCSQKEEIASYL
jgi:hypothetical protein